MSVHNTVKVALEFLDEAAYLVRQTNEIDHLTAEERRDIRIKLAEIATAIGVDGNIPQPA
ncbi:MAG TPA: hypothetical protein VK943_05890 [Arenibaculum sp.]|nr:hypothetical protein [Arenibaculum sp.]